MSLDVLVDVMSVDTLDCVAFSKEEIVDTETKEVLEKLGYVENSKGWEYHLPEEFEPLVEILHKNYFPTLKKLPAGAVLDENKSVKWNREEVAKHNEEVDRYNFVESGLHSVVSRTIKKVIMGEDFYNPYYNKVWDRAWEESHSSGYYEVRDSYEDYVSWLEELEADREYR